MSRRVGAENAGVELVAGKTGGLTLDSDLKQADWLRGRERAGAGDQGRVLRMRYAGGIVKHLGLHMYSGAVPAIAELVANAWDADAKNVEIEIPLNKPLSVSSRISVRDDGIGMSFEDVNSLYLLVGLEKRARGEKTRAGRRVMGRKGIGKLAGFGIAHDIEVWTADTQRHLTAFRLKYDEITRGDKSGFIESYAPEVLADRPMEPGDPIDEQGTLVRLSDLQIRNAINEEIFVDAMARRFAVLSHSFVVRVNGRSVRRSDLDVALRIPRSGTRTEQVPGAGRVRWWAGFTEKPIKIEHARGIAVLVRGKMAQEPFFFRLRGGAHAQVGLEYLTGEVYADFLDEQRDLIATDRASVLWEDPAAEPLRSWGEQKVRELLNKWDEFKKRTTQDRLPAQHQERIRHFPPRERKEISSALRRLSSIPTIEDDQLFQVSDAVIRAYENQHLVDVIREVSEAKDSPGRLAQLLTELRVQEAAGTAALIRARVEALESLRSLSSSAEVDWKTLLRRNPWIAGADWGYLTEAPGSVRRVLSQCERDAGISTTLLWFSGFDRLAGVWLASDKPAPDKEQCERLIALVGARLPRLRVSALAIVGDTARAQGWIVRQSISGLLTRSKSEHQKILARLTRVARGDPRVTALPK